MKLFFRIPIVLAVVLLQPAVNFGQAPQFACGVKVGEVQQDSAIIWVRLTKEPKADFDRLAIFTQGLPSNKKLKLPMPIEVVPGIEGNVSVQYWIKDKPESKLETMEFEVTAKTDFTHQIRLTDLTPGTRYQLKVIGQRESNTNSTAGSFATAPDPATEKPVKFIVSTCQAIRSIDSGPDGHRAYRQMATIKPDFFVHTGDILYYDKVPVAKDMATARAKWNLMFAYRYNREFLLNVPSYFMKDDHDTLKNDCWPGQKYGKLTFDQGLGIFREQVAMGEKTYRTVRWGKDLQVWLTENRDFRSPNTMPDGPEKTILGAQQKAWLMKTVAESNATFKFIISPGPIVGPDKKGKQDNHANAAFANEGQQLRDFIAKQQNTYVICGDRHWQYCSEDPDTGVVELGCGPINDEHNFGGDPGRNPDMHRYFSPKGGFLTITIEGDQATAKWHWANDPDWAEGKLPKVLHEEVFSKQQE